MALMPRELLQELPGSGPDVHHVHTSGRAASWLPGRASVVVALRDGSPVSQTPKAGEGGSLAGEYATVPMGMFYEADLDRVVLRCIIAAARRRPDGAPAFGGTGASLTPRLSTGAVLGAVIGTQDTMGRYMARLNEVRQKLPMLGGLPIDDVLKVAVEPELLAPGEIIFTGLPKELGWLIVSAREPYERPGTTWFGDDCVGSAIQYGRVHIPTRYRYTAGVLVYTDATERTWLDPPRKKPSNLGERLDQLDEDLASECAHINQPATGAGRTSWDHVLEREGNWTVPAEENVRALAGIGIGTRVWR